MLIHCQIREPLALPHTTHALPRLFLFVHGKITAANTNDEKRTASDSRATTLSTGYVASRACVRGMLCVLIKRVATSKMLMTADTKSSQHAMHFTTHQLFKEETCRSAYVLVLQMCVHCGDVVKGGHLAVCVSCQGEVVMRLETGRDAQRLAAKAPR